MLWPKAVTWRMNGASCPGTECSLAHRKHFHSSSTSSCCFSNVSFWAGWTLGMTWGSSHYTQGLAHPLINRVNEGKSHDKSKGGDVVQLTLKPGSLGKVFSHRYHKIISGREFWLERILTGEEAHFVTVWPEKAPFLERTASFLDSNIK